MSATLSVILSTNVATLLPSESGVLASFSLITKSRLIVLLLGLVITMLVIPEVYMQRFLLSRKGRTIPPGPVGLPIVGRYHLVSQSMTVIRCLRLFPFPYSLPGAHSWPLVQEIWGSVFISTWQSTIRDCLWPWCGQRSFDHQRCSVLISKGYIHQVSNNFYSSRYHCLTLQWYLVRWFPLASTIAYVF